MFSYKIKNDELIIEGEMKEGEKISGICCAGFDWEVIQVFKYADSIKDPGGISVWGICDNPRCSVQKNTYDQGTSSYLQEDIALYLLEAQSESD